jgi:hypothetical protein
MREYSEAASRASARCFLTCSRTNGSVSWTATFSRQALLRKLKRARNRAITGEAVNHHGPRVSQSSRAPRGGYTKADVQGCIDGGRCYGTGGEEIVSIVAVINRTMDLPTVDVFGDAGADL